MIFLVTYLVSHQKKIVNHFMIFLDIFRESPNLLRRKNAINFVNYLVKKMILLVPFLVISLVDHFFGEFICQFLARKAVKVLLQYLISSI